MTTQSSRRAVGRGTALVAVTAGVLLAPCLAPASAAQHSFEGSCAGVGVATFDPMGVVPDPTFSASFSYRGRGRCMGTLDGRPLPQGGAPVRVISRGPKPGHSCEAGLDPGARWALTFYPRRSTRGAASRARSPRPRTIVGTMDVIDALRGQVISIYGQTSGVAVDHGQAQGHSETLAACLHGEVTSGIMTMQLDTVTPLVSDELGRGWVNG